MKSKTIIFLILLAFLIGCVKETRKYPNSSRIAVKITVSSHKILDGGKVDEQVLTTYLDKDSIEAFMDNFRQAKPSNPFSETPQYAVSIIFDDNSNKALLLKLGEEGQNSFFSDITEKGDNYILLPESTNSLRKLMLK